MGSPCREFTQCRDEPRVVAKFHLYIEDVGPHLHIAQQAPFAGFRDDQGVDAGIGIQRTRYFTAQ